uniref:Uncharacterized protein n=1 Tax=Lotus japonicus TaxID=34305 RepID=I3T484_LOTJA|nr:unknown [Lotus japonicus]
MIWIAIFLASLAFLWLWRSRQKAETKRLPPGPRGLPILGSQLGLTMIRLVVAQLVHCFD